MRRAGEALQRGDLLLALDIANEAIARGDLSPRLVYQRILALARMGDSHRALAEVRRARLDRSADEDSAALHGRILKDIGLAAPAETRGAILLDARDAYLRALAGGGGYFSAINAATLTRLAGRAEDAAEMGAQVLGDPQVARPAGYYAAATAVEALLLTGRFDEAALRLDAALDFADANPAARASTLRQLLALAETFADRAAVDRLVERLRPPPVAYYSGHVFAADAAAETRLRAEIDRLLDELGIVIGYGALARGADILFAEALLARGAELNVVLPFMRDDFIAQSVVDAEDGVAWRARFDRLIGAAHSVTCAAETAYVGDPTQFRYGSEFAMGLACLRARHLATNAIHLTIWDGEPEAGVGGTGSNVAIWRRWGLADRVIAPGPIRRPTRHVAEAAPAPVTTARESRSLIFTDYNGFSKLGEGALPIFWREVMGRVGEVLDGFGESVLFRNTWGDALYTVIDDPMVAAEVALRLNERIAEVDPVSLGLPAGAGVRIGLHHGPLYRGRDPVTGTICYFGTEVTRTARIEPVTPVRSVYATQPFAAFLALTGDLRYRFQYVGCIPLAKGFGQMPMHVLARAERSRDRADPVARDAGARP